MNRLFHHFASITLAAVLAASSFGCASQPDKPAAPVSAPAFSLQCEGIEEPSGVARAGDHLLIVGDDEHGALFDLPLPPGERSATRIPFDTRILKRVPFTSWELALDLEGVAILADGRTVVLSEARRAILDELGLVATYDHPFAEFAGRGLEGLAVRHRSADSSRIAVLWEGGYPNPEITPLPLPVVVVHDLAPGERRKLVREREALAVAELDVPIPVGSEPAAQRFRAPDLVWRDWDENGARGEGFIVLLSSAPGAPAAPGSPEECSVLENGAPRPYCYKWLQRFRLDGTRVGGHFDLDDAIPEDLRTANWEGMGWFVEGESLVLVHDEAIAERRTNPQQAIVIPLPAGW
jgi:hypothetical protein